MTNVDLRLPNITGNDVETQMRQMTSYMYSLVEQLNWALSTLDEKRTETEIAIVQQGGDGVVEQVSKAEATFAEIKALIIKSADIVEAYYEKMDLLHLSESYIAQSDFGEYLENATIDVEGTPTGIKQTFTRVEAISAKADKVAEDIEMIRQTEAYIKSGLLEETQDGKSIYGVEVGQTDTDSGVFSKFARFTADGIEFYLKGATTPVAWMTGKDLYITSAQITNKLYLGKYVLDTKINDGIAFKWIGG